MPGAVNRVHTGRIALTDRANPVSRAVVRSAFASGLVDGRLAGVLRILTYHTVPDRSAFAAQISWLADRYTPVDQAAVVAAIGGASLPPRPVWVTFDDGDPTVVSDGLPVLRAAGVPATMFVCPGLIESGEPTWWSRVEHSELGVLRALIPVPVGRAPDAVAYLKTVPDPARRALVAELPDGRAGRQLSDAELDEWLDAGFQVGNHSWDHPLLDRCSEDDQRSQVARADAWLRARVPGWTPVFAYPNGNWSSTVVAELDRLGYALAVLHDHRPARSLADPYRISRYDVRADDGIDRYRGVVSGLQPALAAVQDRVCRASKRRPRPH